MQTKLVILEACPESLARKRKLVLDDRMISWEVGWVEKVEFLLGWGVGREVKKDKKEGF